MTSFFPLWKLKGTQPALKMPAMHLVHLEEESAKKDKEVESEDPDGMNGVMEESMVCLVRAVKDAQVGEKHCYHCRHFGTLHPWLPFSKDIESEYAFKLQGGDSAKEGSLGPSDESDHAQHPPGGGPHGIG